MALTLRITKGSALTYAEMDANLSGLASGANMTAFTLTSTFTSLSQAWFKDSAASVTLPNITSRLAVFSTSIATGNPVVNRAYNGATQSIGWIFSRARGSDYTPAALLPGDAVGAITHYGYDGSQYQIGSVWKTEVDNTVSAGIVPLGVCFQVADPSSGGLTEAFRISSARTVTLGGSEAAPALMVVPAVSQTNYVRIEGSTTLATITTNTGDLKLSAASNIVLTPGRLNIGTGYGNSIYAIGSAGAPEIGSSGSDLTLRPYSGILNLANAAGDAAFWVNSGAGNALAYLHAYTGFAGYLQYRVNGVNTARIYSGGNYIGFATGASAGDPQFLVTHVAGATRYVTVAGSVAGNPIITTSGGSLQITPSLIGLSFLQAWASTAPPAGGGAAGLYLGNSGTLGIYFGSGVPSCSAANGSIYIRTDGSGHNDRVYVNNSGAGAWEGLLSAGALESFTFSVVSGLTTTPSGTAYYVTHGNAVLIMFPFLSGTSNSTGFTFSGIPAAIRPSAGTNIHCETRDNGGNFVIGKMVINTDGTASAYPPDGSTWTASGIKAISQIAVGIYFL